VDYLIATDVAARVSDSFQQHHLLTWRSVVAEYVIFFTTLYDIIFLWWSYTHNNDQNVSVEHDSKERLLNFPPKTLMSWNDLPHAHYVGSVTQLCVMRSPNALPNIVGRGLTIPYYIIYSTASNFYHCSSSQIFSPESIMVHYLPRLLGSVNRMLLHSGCSCVRKLYISCHLGMGPLTSSFSITLVTCAGIGHHGC
jgi:hypothetical protein